MKKEDISGIVAYILILAFAIIFGVSVLQQHVGESFVFRNGGQIAYLGFMLGAIVFGLILNASLYELGHLAGGKIGGYDVAKINILGVEFTKFEGKWRVKFAGFDGLTGETKIYPIENFKDKKGEEKEPNPYGYLWFGTLFITVEIIIAMIAFVLLQNGDRTSIASDFGYFFLTSSMIGLMILIYNILPFRLDTITDGYKLTLVSNPKNKNAFNELLRVERAIENGEEVEIKTFTEITNFTADLNLNKVYQLLQDRKFEEAEVLIDMIIEAKEEVNAKVYIRARAQKIYINLMNNDLEKAKEFYEKNVPVSERREIADDISMPSIRAYLLMAGLLDKSKSECLIVLGNVIKAYKKTPKARQKVELELFNETLQKVITAHPKWGLEGYLLAVEEKESKKK